MKESCPNCESTQLGDRWTNGRKLEQYCYDCDWIDEPRIPEQLKIKTTKKVCVGQFSGFEYEVFDRYGHLMISSRTYNTDKAAEAALLLDMKRSETDKDAGPYTAVLWPASTKVTGKVFK